MIKNSCKSLLLIFIFLCLIVGVLLCYTQVVCLLLYLLGVLLLTSVSFFMFKVLKNLRNNRQKLYRVVRNNPKLRELILKDERW
jgi:hypothetical protein